MLKKKPFVSAQQVRDALRDAGEHAALSTTNRIVHEQKL